MGVILPQTVMLAPYSKAKYYKEKGYIINKPKNKIEINVEDLSPSSQQLIKCKCNNCGCEFKRKFAKIKNKNITFCLNCSYEQTKLTNLKRYGVEHTSQSLRTKEKIKQTNLKKYGVEYCWQAKEVKEKIKQTNLEKYGVEHALQNSNLLKKQKDTMIKRYGEDNALKVKKIRQKVRQTCINKYGVDNPAKSKKIQNKIKNTNMKKYGTYNASKSQVVKDKIRESNFKYFNDVKVSKQQIKISNLLKGEINKNIKGYFPDIVVDNFIIEYDGSGHWLAIDVWKNDKKDFEYKEKIRENVFIHNGYFLIRIISKDDKLPEDNIILSTIEIIKNNLLNNDYKIARWNLADNSIIYE